MQIEVMNRTSFQASADVRIVWFYEGGECFSVDEQSDEEARKMIDYLLESGEFSGKDDEIQYLRLGREQAPNKLLLIGLGKKEELSSEKLRKRVGKSLKALQQHQVKSAEIAFIPKERGAEIIEMVKLFAETTILANYRFKKFLSEDDKPETEHLYILCDEEHENAFRKAVNEGVLLGQSTNFARDLVNEPANILVPDKLADEARRIGAESGFDVEVYDETRIRELKMYAFWEVAKAAVNPPRFIVMRYVGNPDKKDEIVGFVGKGLTYDSGGLSLKTKEGMIDMKCDMAGSAAVIAAMSAIARANLPVNVVAVVAACENMVSATSYRPGDIISSMAGKSIMVISTDAEGRLTMADALYYITQQEGAKRVIDIATLTGAAANALGRLVSAVMANDDAFYRDVERAATLADERLCRVPLVDEYKERIKAKHVDLLNSGGKNGAGMIVAGLFLREFIGDIPWVHIDIAGTAWSGKEWEYLPEGGTGVGVRTLYYLATLSK